MLHAISWQQYLTAITLAALAWYAYIGIRFYRADLLTLFRPVRNAGHDLVPEVPGDADVMGKAKPDGSDTVSSGELVFGDAEPDTISSETVPRGPSDELLDEGRSLINAHRELNDKKTFLSLLDALLDRYELQRDEISLASFKHALAEHAKDVLPFSLSKSEWAAVTWPNH